MKGQNVEQVMLDPVKAGSFDEELPGQGLRILARMIARYHMQREAPLELKSRMTREEPLEEDSGISTLP